MHITLVIPELIWPEPEDPTAFDALACPALTRLLARGELVQSAPESFEATLCALFGYPADTAYAALRWQGENQVNATDEGNSPTSIPPTKILCCDPVHLRFHQESLILADASQLGLTLAEAQNLAETLNTQLAELGQIEVVRPERWYWHLAESSQAGLVESPPLSAVAGRRVEHLLTAATSNKTLQQGLIAIQMLLHTHPVNLARQKNGQASINHLWVWGDGSASKIESNIGEYKANAPFDALYCNASNTLALGLARATHTAMHPQTLDATKLLAEQAPHSRQLVVLDELLSFVAYEDSENYQKTLNELETRWFAPLFSALKRGKVKMLSVVVPTSYARFVWKNQPSSAWKLWRRTLSLQTFASRLVRPPE